MAENSYRESVSHRNDEDIGDESSARADADDKHERIQEKRAPIIEDEFGIDSLPPSPTSIQGRSPLRPSFSLLGIRWVNASQLLTGNLGFPNSHDPLFEEPPTQIAGIVESSCELQQQQIPNTSHLCSQQSQRNNTDNERADETNHHFSFVSVAFHPVDAGRRCLHASEDGRKFAADDNNSSNPPENPHSNSSSSLENNPNSGTDSPDSGGITTSEYCASSSPDSSNFRFTSDFIMPVPQTFRSSWSIEHVPEFHISSAPDKIKKLLGDKEMRRDDNFNLEEVTETEVPASRLHAGLRNGNGVHQTHEDVSDDEPPQRSVPKNSEYSESVRITRVPSREEYRYGVRYDIDDSRRYRDEVRLVPGQTNPGRYYSSLTTCYPNSDYRRYKETLYVNLNAPNPKHYTTSVFVFPKSCRETFVSEVEHYDEETIKWYKVGVTMEARDYVSVKFVQVN